MQLRTLLTSRPALERLAALKLPARAAYNVAKTLKAVGAEMEAFEAGRQAILKAHDGAANEQADAEFQVLLGTELTDFHPHLLKLEWLPDGELTAGEMLALDWLILAPENGE